MRLNTRFKLTILAGAVALAVGTPAAFAQGQSGMHQDPGGTPDSPAARHSPEVMDKNPQSSTKPDEGTQRDGIHQDADGTPDSPAARHGEQVMKKQPRPSTEKPQSSTGSTRDGMHQDPGGTPDAPAARHSETVK